MNIDSVKLINNKNQITFEQYNIKNTLHTSGQEFILKAIFSDTDIVPRLDNNITYYVGLDNRGSIDKENGLQNLGTEPTTNNYRRQPISNWSLSKTSAGVWVAKSSSIVFTALSSQSSNSGWGPVSNIFLTTVENRCTTQPCSGYLISSSKLDSPISLSSGDKIVLEMSLSIFS